jgi:hypothetical protein
MVNITLNIKTECHSTFTLKMQGAGVAFVDTYPADYFLQEKNWHDISPIISNEN